MISPLAHYYNHTFTVYKGLAYKLSSEGVLDNIPGHGRWQTSHCRAIVRLTVGGGPSGSATAHNRGLVLSTEGRCTRTKEKKCGRCSVSGSGAGFHGRLRPVPCRLSLGVRVLGVACRWEPVPGGFEAVVGRGGGGNPPGSSHG